MNKKIFTLILAATVFLSSCASTKLEQNQTDSDKTKNAQSFSEEITFTALPNWEVEKLGKKSFGLFLFYKISSASNETIIIASADEMKGIPDGYTTKQALTESKKYFAKTAKILNETSDTVIYLENNLIYITRLIVKNQKLYMIHGLLPQKHAVIYQKLMLESIASVKIN